MDTQALTEVVRAPLGYRAAELCGRGATSRVYRAVTAQGQVVALKRLHRHLVRSKDALARLKRELDALQQLRHPGIVAVKDVITWEGDPTLVMEFVDGEDLKERLTRAGSLKVAEAEDLARQLLDILATTHTAGIVHRDIKPHNIRLDDKGQVRLLDFGSARLDAASLLTATGTTVGTPEYMAPELFTGSVYDPRVDIYGVGATLYECLTGRPPHHADSQAQLAFAKSTQPAPPIADLRDDVPPALAQVIDRCLMRAPEARYATAALAVWALDHPDAERAFLARRQRNPLCLHCHNAIAPGSGICPVCKSPRPFRYSPGSTHVELRTVTDAARFMEHVALHFPHRAQVNGLMALAQDVAALASGPVRYVSFISKADAERVVTELAEVGVVAQAVPTGSWSAAGVMVAVGGALAAGSESVMLAPVAVGAAWVMGRLFNVLDARDGVLSSYARVRDHAAGLKRALLGTTAASGLAVAMGLTGILDGWMFHGATVTAGVAGLLGYLATQVGARSIGTRGLLPSPEPGVGQQLTRTWLGSGKKEVKPEDQLKGIRGVTAVLMLMMLVPLELWGLGGLLQGGAIQVPTISVPAPTAPMPAIPGPVVAPRTSVFTQKVLVATGEGTALLGGGALGSALVRRRRKRLQLEGTQILAELDLPKFRQLAERSGPAGGAPHTTALARMAAFQAPDAFAQQALKRAVDLASQLPKETVLALSDAVETLCSGRQVKEEEASLLARCILETDPDLATRFKFLALEGQLEAQAAEAWVRKVGNRS